MTVRRWGSLAGRGRRAGTASRSLALAAAVLVLAGLTACGGEQSTGGAAAPATTPVETAETTTTTPSSSPTPVPPPTTATTDGSVQGYSNVPAELAEYGVDAGAWVAFKSAAIAGNYLVEGTDQEAVDLALPIVANDCPLTDTSGKVAEDVSVGAAQSDAEQFWDAAAALC